MKRKILLAILLALISISCITVYASTADSVNEATEVDTLMSQFGSDYVPPFTISGDEVNLYEGEVTYKELDLSLPGKNGHNLNLYRAYNSNQNLNGYKYNGYITTGAMQTVPVYRYTIGGQEHYILFNNEADVVDSITTDTSKVNNNVRTDASGFKYQSISSVKVEGGNLTLIRDKTADKVWLREKSVSDYRDYINNKDVAIGENWSVRMPQLVRTLFSTNVSDTIRRYTYLFRSETGESDNIKYAFEKTDAGWVLVEDSIEMEYDSGYESTVYPETQSHKLGFNYDVAISDINGKTYYFNMNISARDNSILPVAVIDRYDNAIYYTQNADGSVKIVDTMGRIVNVSSSGISVTAGDTNKSVVYSQREIYDSERDPYGKLACLTTHVLSVSRNSDDNTDITEYYMKYRPIMIDSTYEEYSPKVTKTVYPTNAYIEYIYENEPSIKKYAVNSNKGNTTCDYEEYRVKQKNIYENGSLKNTEEYIAKDFSNKTKTVEVRGTLPGDVKKYDKYSYDSYGRLTKETVSFNPTTAGKSVRVEYGYSDTFSELPREDLTSGKIKSIRSAYIMNTRKYIDNKLVSSYDTGYNKKRFPTHKEQGEYSEDYTYDESYGIPLTETVKRDMNTTVKTVNTLTADKKNIAQSKVYENNALKKTIEYSYNSDGTVAQTKEQSDEYGNIVTDYDYTYNTDGSYSTEATVKNVKNADNVTSDIQTTKSCDSLGRLASETDGNGNVTSYSYDKADRIIKQTNPDGTYKTVSYNIAQNSVTVTDENGSITTTDYTPFGKPEKVYLNNNTNDIVGEYTYDKLDRVVKKKAYQELKGSSVTEQYTYDVYDRVTQKNCTSTQGAMDTEAYSYDYDVSFEELGSIYTSNPIDVSEYDKALVVVVSPAGYSGNENKVTVYTDEASVYTAKLFNGQTDTVAVDLHNKSKLKVNASRKAEVYVKYLKDSDEINLLGDEGQTVTMTYTGDSTYVKPTEVKHTDGFGNIVSETYYEHGTETVLNKNIYKYDGAGNVLETLGGRNYMEGLSDYTTKTEYDYMGNPIKSYRADGSYTTATYNKQGQAVSTTDYLGNTTTAKYDQLGRVIKSETPFDAGTNTKTLTFYDNNGNITETREQNNEIGKAEHYKVTKYEYDSRNRLVCVQVNDGSRDIYTQYAYDNVGNLVKTVTGQTSKLSNLYGTLPAEAASNTYEYDRFGNVTKHTDAMGQSETAQYNLMNLPITQTDRNGNVTTNTYNAYGSMLTSTVGTDVITNTYSVNNLLVRASNGQSGGDVSYTYDAYGNVASETTNGVSNTYTYDTDGNRKSFTQKEGTNTIQNASYTYDSINQLTKVSFGNGISASYTYDANGRLKQENRGVVSSTYTYNKAGLVTNLSNTKGNSYDYTYRLDGNQIKESNDDYDTYYRYNDIGQLVYEFEDVTAITYTYDTRGNRISLFTDDDNYTTIYKYDKNNRLLSENKTSTSFDDETDTTYNYDKNGNTLRKIIQRKKTSSAAYEPVNDITYSYNRRNELIYYDNIEGDFDNESQCGYKYDAIGRLRNKHDEEGGDLINYYWDGSNIVFEEKCTRNDVYFRGINMIAQNAGETTSYYVYNAHGDTTSLVNSSGSVVRTYDNDAFGNSIANYGTGATTSFRYNGQYTDIDTGLIYLRNRFYDPTTGRFTQEDTYWNVNNMIYGDKQYEEEETKIPDYFAIAQSGNLYAYCMNDPVNLCDILGSAAGDLFKTSDDAAIDWAYNYYGITEYSAIEHASLLYMIQGDNGEWYYSYTVVKDFEPLSSDPYSLQHHVDAIGGTTVGFIHSHPFTNYPSDIDKTIAENNGHIIYVVGESLYSDGVDVCKYYDYGYGFSTYAVGSDLSYRELSDNEKGEAFKYFKGKWNLYYDDIQKGFNYKWKERGYL